MDASRNRDRPCAYPHALAAWHTPACSNDPKFHFTCKKELVPLVNLEPLPPITISTAFHDINGFYASSHRHLIDAATSRISLRQKPRRRLAKLCCESSKSFVVSVTRLARSSPSLSASHGIGAILQRTDRQVALSIGDNRCRPQEFAIGS